VVAAGQAVYGLAWAGDTDVVLDASSADVGEIAIDQTATVSFPALPGEQLQARVREIAPAADPATRTYRVKLTLDGTSQAIRLGMSGAAELAPRAATGPAEQVPLASTFTIPSTALFHRGETPAVWVLDAHSRLELRSVSVRRHGAISSIITTGLKDGDVIVVAGAHAVYAGEPVRTVKPLFDEEGEVAGPAPQVPPAVAGAGGLARADGGASR
jgi:RND family efflux transporter MFP subunit